jgi:hypothetical protein
LELVCGLAKIALTIEVSAYLAGNHIEMKAADTINGDAGVINWNCGAAQSPPAAPGSADGDCFINQSTQTCSLRELTRPAADNTAARPVFVAGATHLDPRNWLISRR